MDAQGPGVVPLDAEQREHLRLLRESAGRSLVISDVLDYSASKSADLRFDGAPLSPRWLLERVVGCAGGSRAGAGWRWHCRSTTACRRWLLGDASHLAQIVDNLLGNAIKFTEQGGIEVRSRASPGQRSRPTARARAAPVGRGQRRGHRAGPAGASSRPFAGRRSGDAPPRRHRSGSGDLRAAVHG